MVINGQRSVVYCKRKSEEVRYTNQMAEVDLAELPKNVLSRRKIGPILAFSVKIRAEFAELDVLRDRADHRIYFVDLNPTPCGPPLILSSQETESAFKHIQDFLKT